jgi:AraC-like DNA-binding protein
MNHKKYNEFIEFVSNNYYNPDITLQSIQEKLNYSHDCLNEICRNLHNTSIKNYLNQYRLKMAIEIIFHCDKPDELANLHLKIGFNYRSHLSILFKECFEITLAEVKRIIKDKNRGEREELKIQLLNKLKILK